MDISGETNKASEEARRAMTDGLSLSRRVVGAENSIGEVATQLRRSSGTDSVDVCDLQASW